MRSSTTPSSELGALGAQIYTHVHGRAMDAAEFDPFYARVAELGGLLQVHPCRSSAWADYPTEERSKFEIWWTFGWEYDLSAFMARIVFSGVLERHPDLKLLIHHGGSMVPHFAGRVGPGWDQLGARTPETRRTTSTGYPLTKRPVDYFKMMYADTAMFGAGTRATLFDRLLRRRPRAVRLRQPLRPRARPRLHPVRRSRTSRRSASTEEQQDAIFHGNVQPLASGSA